MNNEKQSYANHRRSIPLLYRFAGLLIVVAIGLLIYKMARGPSLGTAAMLTLALGNGIAWFWVRAGDLTLQNRIIRAEMHARLERVLGANRRQDFERLTIGQ